MKFEKRMRKTFFKLIEVFGNVIVTGTIFQEDDLMLFVVKGAFLIVFIVVLYLLVTSKRTRKFLE